jgi:mannose-6-phosphate isomerase-like protein (cupin superfamily)
MVKKREQMPTEVRRQMRGGQGEVEILHIFRQEEMKGRCRLFALLRLGPGCSIGSHPHEQEEEVFYVLKGEARVAEGGRTHRLGPGDATLTGGGASHSIENTGTEPLEVLAAIILYQ